MQAKGERNPRPEAPSKTHPLEFLERHLPPDRFEQFIRGFGGSRIWIPIPYDYEERNSRLRARWRELRIQGARPTDAKSTLATEFSLSRKRVEDLVYGPARGT